MSSLYDEVSDAIDTLKPFEKITVDALAERMDRDVCPTLKATVNRFVNNHVTDVSVDDDGNIAKTVFGICEIESFLDSLRNAKLTVRGHDLITNLVIHINEEKTFSVVVPDNEAADLSNALLSNMLASFGSTLDL